MAQSGARSSSTYGFKAPAVGLGVGLAWESMQQGKFAGEHRDQRARKLERIEGLERAFGW